MSNETKQKSHAAIIMEARDKYTVHNCNECDYRKSCDMNSRGFDSDKCREMRQSIMLGFGIEDGYFTELLDRLEAAHKREIVEIVKSIEAKMFDTLQPLIERAIYKALEIQKQALEPGGGNAALFALARIGDALNKKARTTPASVTEHERAVMRICCSVFAGTMPSIDGGNAAAMREALLSVLCRYESFISGSLPTPSITAELCDKCRAALAMPRRNCDVGTVEEQEERYRAIGETYHTLTLTNALKWSQMPYEADAAREEGGK